MKSNPIHEKILNVIAVFLILFIIFNVSINFFYWEDGWTEILWYCDFAAILLSLGIIFRKNYLISGVLITAIPAQFLWILDFVMKIVGFDGFGRTAWMFALPTLTILPSVIIHLVLIPISIYATFLYGFNKRGYLVGLGILLFAMIMPFFFSAQDDNINCVFYSCDLDFEHSATYHYLSIPSYSIQYILFIALRWVFFGTIVYFVLLKFFRSVFKQVKVY